MNKAFASTIAALSFLISTAEAATLPAYGLLWPGQTLSSDAGNYYLVMQPTDGHLVLYRRFDGKPIWYTGKPAGPGAWAVFQGDRNLVVYKAGPGIPSNAAWWSSTSINGSDPGAYLAMRDNGALYMHTSTGKIVWSTPVDPMAPASSICLPNAPQRAFPICIHPGTDHQRTWTQYACTWERAAEILTHTVNHGAVMGPCD